MNLATIGHDTDGFQSQSQITHKTLWNVCGLGTQMCGNICTTEFPSKSNGDMWHCRLFVNKKSWLVVIVVCQTLVRLSA